MSRIRLAIGTPTTGFVRVEFMESIIEAQKALLIDPKLKIDKTVFLYHCSSVIPNNRNYIVNQARKWGATHILWVDDDMMFPPRIAVDLMRSMVKHKAAIMGANCIKRTYPIEFMARDFEGKVVDSVGKTGVEVVMFTGNAFVVMDMKLFDVIEQPWFAFPWDEKQELFGTEDHYFMDKAGRHGFETYIDHGVGIYVDHIGSWPFQANDKFDRR